MSVGTAGTSRMAAIRITAAPPGTAPTAPMAITDTAATEVRRTTARTDPPRHTTDMAPPEDTTQGRPIRRPTVERARILATLPTDPFTQVGAATTPRARRTIMAPARLHTEAPRITVRPARDSTTRLERPLRA